MGIMENEMETTIPVFWGFLVLRIKGLELSYHNGYI